MNGRDAFFNEAHSHFLEKSAIDAAQAQSQFANYEQQHPETFWERMVGPTPQGGPTALESAAGSPLFNNRFIDAARSKASLWGPAAGGLIGTAMAPGIGTAIGAGLGSYLGQSAERPGQDTSVGETALNTIAGGLGGFGGTPIARAGLQGMRGLTAGSKFAPLFGPTMMGSTLRPALQDALTSGAGSLIRGAAGSTPATWGLAGLGLGMAAPHALEYMGNQGSHAIKNVMHTMADNARPTTYDAVRGSVNAGKGALQGVGEAGQDFMGSMEGGFRSAVQKAHQFADKLKGWWNEPPAPAAAAQPAAAPAPAQDQGPGTIQRALNRVRGGGLSHLFEGGPPPTPYPASQ